MYILVKSPQKDYENTSKKGGNIEKYVLVKDDETKVDEPNLGLMPGLKTVSL